MPPPPQYASGSLVWGQNFNYVSKLRKKVIRTVTRCNYIAHLEALLKELNLLSVKDLMDLNFLHKLYDNKLPIYFNEYMSYLEACETKYNFRIHPLPVPRVAHAFAESCHYKLVKIKNKLATYHKLIHKKIIESFSLKFQQLCCEYND